MVSRLHRLTYLWCRWMILWLSTYYESWLLDVSCGSYHARFCGLWLYHNLRLYKRPIAIDDQNGAPFSKLVDVHDYVKWAKVYLWWCIVKIVKNCCRDWRMFMESGEIPFSKRLLREWIQQVSSCKNSWCIKYPPVMTNITMEHWPFVVDLPIEHGGSFHSYVKNYQRVPR